MKSEKSDKFNVRVSVSEREAFKKWIHENSSLRIRGRAINENALIRSLIRWFLGLDKPIHDNELIELRQLKNELSSIGGNLNQLTKAYNEGLIKTPINGDEFFKKVLAEVNTVRKRQHLIVAHLEQGLTTKLSEVLDGE